MLAPWGALLVLPPLPVPIAAPHMSSPDAPPMWDTCVRLQASGGGTSGQAQAAAHGIARALQNYDPAR